MIERVKTGCEGADPDLLPIAIARRRIESAVSPVSGTEMVPLAEGLNRILAREVVSPLEVPAYTNSALDGYAVSSLDLPRDGTARLEVIGTAWAGRPLTAPVRRAEAARIMTGAPMPGGTDTVIAEERATRRGDTVEIGAGHKMGQNVRQAGEDLALGQVAVRAGKRLMPAELGLLASLGLARVEVVRRLRVALFSTGDELRMAGEPIEAGGVYDSNRFTLHALLARMGAEVRDGGIIRDQREAVEKALLEAAGGSDVIITSGGVSTGAADFVEAVLAEHGELSFWRVAIKPGRPLAFGRLGEAVFFGLPGNPVAVMVTFYQFLRFALGRMMGEIETPVWLFRARCATRLRKKAGRTEFYRGVLERGESGELLVRRTARQGSGVLSSMSEANCFIILPDDRETVEPGAEVEVQPFFGLV